jgi:hypothetical protein
MFSCALRGQDGAIPPMRHTVQLQMPTRLIVRRTQSQLSDSFDLALLRKVRIKVDRNMFIGLKDEVRIYPMDGRRPQSPGRVGYGSIDEQDSEPAFLKSTGVWDRVRDGVPSAGERYTVEHDITIFETDVPPEHLWQPKAGRYRVLWNRKMKADSQ